MNTSRTPATPTSRSADTLAHAGLIRLISEIDDNGPLQRRMLATTLHGLSRRQLTHATTTGRRLGLLRTGRQAGNACYVLTSVGRDLAEVYDIAARWARTYHYPHPVSDFTTRVQATLTLLAQHPGNTAEAGPDDEAARTLHSVRAALSQWSGDHGDALVTDPVSARAQDGMELAA
ncbi:regulator [Streptomyces flavotricini]|uniref:Regulator n=1 Tax=Streptomyces flavotricini TaxID=66888 RepID=A0ABS8E0J8_9ACTN|nr:regulator [Streptomyces flavotricini]MCC0094670.1 regulator [Streptomyces flavotricini]